MAARPECRLVVDANVLVRGLASRNSPSGRLLWQCEEGNVVLLLSRAIMREYRDVLSRDELTLQHPAITADVVALVIERLRYFAEIVDPVRAHFRYDRDPDDQCFIELAISGGATHILTHDNDLLSLPNQHTDAARRFRQRLRGVRVLRPSEFLRELGA